MQQGAQTQGHTGRQGQHRGRMLALTLHDYPAQARSARRYPQQPAQHCRIEPYLDQGVAASGAAARRQRRALALGGPPVARRAHALRGPVQIRSSGMHQGPGGSSAFSTADRPARRCCVTSHLPGRCAGPGRRQARMIVYFVFDSGFIKVWLHLACDYTAFRGRDFTRRMIVQLPQRLSKVPISFGPHSADAEPYELPLGTR
jgi:hypothetical protein